MTTDNSDKAELRVSTHVLVQLGSELVTDVEQAILECVKNAYDADSPGCLIDIDTKERGELRAPGLATDVLKFSQKADSVDVSFEDEEGIDLSERNGSVEPDAVVRRVLQYRGRVTIEDRGSGLSEAQLRDSWLVVSGSNKRASEGPKRKTKKGRTPLGDKGLGRLGTMKLGDILLVESSPAESSSITSAYFRWKDCETADTIDRIPVTLLTKKNKEQFRGTRVSVLGLHDLSSWRQPDRIFSITRSLAKLISPFEATSTFPVTVRLDGKDQSLVSVTNDVISRAVAEFEFAWTPDQGTGEMRLRATARFKRRLFERNKEKTPIVFADEGQEFLQSVEKALLPRLKRYENIKADPSGTWLIELSQSYSWSSMQPDKGVDIGDPGAFTGSFYFFFLDDMDEPDAAVAAGIGPSKALVKEMAGISILRDGFRVRSQGDWLGLSAGMTSGSTYHMRVNNTVGYFALTGEHNYRLVEKSDREGFVDDATLRGFLQIASTCRNFSNDALENIRRAYDSFYTNKLNTAGNNAPKTAASSLSLMEQSVKSAEAAKLEAAKAAVDLAEHLAKVEKKVVSSPNSKAVASEAVELAKSALTAIGTIQRRLASKPYADIAAKKLRQELFDNKERAYALYESAAVGLSARGMAHELRTHLAEIKQRTSALQKLIKANQFDEDSALAHLKAIRGSCAGISNAASLIDPMLPRARATKEVVSLGDFVKEYVKGRGAAFEREEIRVRIVAPGKIPNVRINRARLLQVLDNLVRNSVYWMRRGHQTSEVTREKVLRIDITDGGFVVSDSGPGVDPSYEESIFEIFVTTKPNSEIGQGLGLFIVSQLLAIDRCDIHLSNVRNEDGRRYKFVVNLRPVIV